MRRALAPLFLLLLACGAAGPGTASAGLAAGSALAIPLLADGERPELILAQRTIDRAWGPSEDSTYVEVSVPGWKSEGWAFVLSGAVPGAGHAYLGESSGFFFALLEVAGWTARSHFDSRSDQLREDGVRYVGVPTDSNSTWSFRRWEASTGGDASELRTLYVLDPSTFYARIAHEPAYLAGWSGKPIPARDKFRNFLDRADGMLQRSRYATTTIWLNHVVAAFDALRAARITNMPLQENLRLKVRTGWRNGSPTVVATLERRF
jgi:hypothetical protein